MATRETDLGEHLESLHVAANSGDGAAMANAARSAQIALETLAAEELDEPSAEARRDSVAVLSQELMERAAELGDIDAAIEVAEQIWWRQDNTRSALARRYLTRAAQRPRAQTLLGWFDAAGFGGPIDPQSAVAHHHRAAHAGEADSLFEMYLACAQGIAMPKDEAAALDWCERAARAGHARAMATLGGLYATGSGVIRDIGASIRWYTEAADLGHGRAAATLGVLFAKGDGITPNPDTARRWFQTARDLGYDPLEMMIATDVDPVTYEQS